MLDFDLYNDVITEFAQDFTFTRFTKTINSLGREVLTPEVPTVINCYIHPATDQDLKSVSRDGYFPEDTVKIFAEIDADILQDDHVSYRNRNYRVMKDNFKIVGDYSKFFAELVVS
jgi:hypothetical protein